MVARVGINQRVSLKVNRRHPPLGGRASGSAGPQAQERDAALPQESAARGWDHLHLRHPRPGRGPHHERQDRGDERLCSRSPTLQPSTSTPGTASSLTLSARRTCSRVRSSP